MKKVFTVLDEPYGYRVDSGYIGYITKKDFMMFPTEKEYREHLKELKEATKRC